MPDYTPRENIADYITEDEKGGLFLNKQPCDFDENDVFIAPAGTTIIDLAQLMVVLNIPSPVPYEVVYEVCEHLLQAEEANPGSVFQGTKATVH